MITSIIFLISTLGMKSALKNSSKMCNGAGGRITPDSSRDGKKNLKHLGSWIVSWIIRFKSPLMPTRKCGANHTPNTFIRCSLNKYCKLQMQCLCLWTWTLIFCSEAEKNFSKSQLVTIFFLNLFCCFLLWKGFFPLLCTSKSSKPFQGQFNTAANYRCQIKFLPA